MSGAQLASSGGARYTYLALALTPAPTSSGKLWPSTSSAVTGSMVKYMTEVVVTDWVALVALAIGAVAYWRTRGVA